MPTRPGFFLGELNFSAVIKNGQLSISFPNDAKSSSLNYSYKSRLGDSKTRSFFPKRVKHYNLAEAIAQKSRLKAERAWYLSDEERRAMPETEQLLPRWGKSCVLLSALARASFKRFFLPQASVRY